MDKKFLMGAGDGLVRSKYSGPEVIAISAGLRDRFRKKAIELSLNFFTDFLGKSTSSESIEELFEEYGEVYEEAKALNLFDIGGIGEKDHLNFWILSKVFRPRTYIESGVFIGSSFQAFTRAGVKHAIAIDPNIHVLRVPKSSVNNGQFVSDKDFSQLEIDNIDDQTLAYFDDHVNTAKRIIQANDKGIKYLCFDDSTGFEGICQRLYPAMPTLPIIMNAGLLRLGDELTWTHDQKVNSALKKLKELRSVNRKKVQLKVDQDFIDLCNNAKNLVDKWATIPNLGDYVPQTKNRKFMDVTKYMVKLK